MFRGSRGKCCGRGFGRRNQNMQIENSSIGGFGLRDKSDAGVKEGRGMNKNTQPCRGDGRGMGMGNGRGNGRNRAFSSAN